jgi:transcriptional regulator with XRE-family HTH domain
LDFLVLTVDQLSDHLRAFRRARGLTQAQLGALIGVKQARMADIENDPGSVSVAQLHQILTAAGAQFILRGDDAAAPAKLAAEVGRKVTRIGTEGIQPTAQAPASQARRGSATGRAGGSPSVIGTKIIPATRPKKGRW